MPRIQSFVSHKVITQIDGIVKENLQEGASDQEANISSVTSMLIELGLRVYKLQREDREGGFNQMEYNKIILENVLKSSYMCSMLVQMLETQVDINVHPEFKFSSVAEKIRGRVKDVVIPFFPEESAGSED